MFAVFGVCKAHCQESAKKRTLPFLEVGEKRIDLSPSEWEQKKNENAAAIFNKAKPKKISGIFTEKSCADQFRALLLSSGEGRAVVIKRKEYLRRNGSVVLNKKTKNPRLVWVDAE